MESEHDGPAIIFHSCKEKVACVDFSTSVFCMLPIRLVVLGRPHTWTTISFLFSTLFYTLKVNRAKTLSTSMHIIQKI
jgi:hypothetical protein